MPRGSIPEVKFAKSEAKRAHLEANTAAITRLRSLVLEMGLVIRTLDEDHEHLEFWTQDGDYVLDGRFGN